MHIQWLYALWKSLFPCIFADVLINAAPILPAKYKDMKGVRHKTKKPKAKIKMTFNYATFKFDIWN